MLMTTTTQMSPLPRRGDVVLVLYPNSDLRTAKRRPASVIQADELNTGLAQIIVAMINSRLFRAIMVVAFSLRLIVQKEPVPFSGGICRAAQNALTLRPVWFDRLEWLYVFCDNH